MVDKPIQKAIESGTETVKEHSKVLCSWIEDPHMCECGTYCDATTEFIEEQMLPTRIWKCPECGNRYYRNRE